MLWAGLFLLALKSIFGGLPLILHEHTSRRSPLEEPNCRKVDWTSIVQNDTTPSHMSLSHLSRLSAKSLSHYQILIWSQLARLLLALFTKIIWQRPHINGVQCFTITLCKITRNLVDAIWETDIVST